MAHSEGTSDRVVNSRRLVEVKMQRFLVILSVVAAVRCFEMNEDQIQVANFNVKPGGALLSFEKDWVCGENTKY